jgi:hypothetical protein
LEVEVLGSVDLYVRSGHGVDPYFHLPMSRPSDGWRKVWFFLRNNTDALLPVFTSSRPIPQPNWGTEWPGRTSVGYNPYMRSFNSYYMEG